MNKPKNALMMLLLVFSVGCSGVEEVVTVEKPIPESKLVKIPFAVEWIGKSPVPKGSRIFIADISGPCVNEVKNALLQRLIDNSDYDVLTRENLRQISAEFERQWGSGFDTDTVAGLGALMGASLFIVGEVSYCGTVSNNNSGPVPGAEFGIMGTFLLIDIETGKVLMSSYSEGRYSPRPIPVLFPDKETADQAAREMLEEERKERRKGQAMERVDSYIEKAGDAAILADDIGSFLDSDLDVSDVQQVGALVERVGNLFRRKPPPSSGEPEIDPNIELEIEPESYAKVKAAEDLANGFADKFFARPTWQNVEMWMNNHWYYGDSIRYVRLGKCPQAVGLMDVAFTQEFELLPEKNKGEFLHNYGVALMCANNPEAAVRKLFSAYRVGNQKSTLNMLGVAARMVEWRLDGMVDMEPEVEFMITD